jgi:hypothetical protein
MVDNINVTPGTGATVAADLVTIDGASALVQRVKPVFGAPGSGADADIGAGTGGSATQRVIVDSSQFSALGQTTMALSAPVVMASNQSAIPVNATGVDQYATHKEVAASQTATALGTGATGDYLSHVIVFPGTAGCGVVTILDLSTGIGTFAGGGTTALPSLVPFIIPVGAFSVNGAWKITTGANVTVSAVGKFTP